MNYIIIIYSYKMREILAILNGLGNEVRLRIFSLLLERDLCVCELQELLKMEQSRLSHQLRLMRYLGLVETKQEGRWVVYSIPEKIRKNPIVRSIRQSLALSPEFKEKVARIDLRKKLMTKEESQRKDL